jgi:hypothetical protein
MIALATGATAGISPSGGGVALVWMELTYR